MKRKGNLYQKIAEPENLRLAFFKAARGKADRLEVKEYRAHLGDNLALLHNQLLDHQPDIGHYRFFNVRDPKPRKICAASFPERVLHHAIMNICEPVLDSYLIYDSYACRRGKGQRQAVARAQVFARASFWYLKLDIKKYFDSIDHQVVLQLLGRRFKDPALLDLFGKLVATYSTVSGKGVPIGNLISQHFANFYLGRLDHWLKENRRIRYYLRYMDDFLLYSMEKSTLRAELVNIESFLHDELQLQLKENVQLNRCANGIPFLGYRIFPGKIHLGSRSKRRFLRKFQEYEKQMVDGIWDEAELARHMEPLLDFTRVARSENFRKSVIMKYGVSF